VQDESARGVQRTDGETGGIAQKHRPLVRSLAPGTPCYPVALATTLSAGGEASSHSQGDYGVYYTAISRSSLPATLQALLA